MSAGVKRLLLEKRLWVLLALFSMMGFSLMGQSVPGPLGDYGDAPDAESAGYTHLDPGTEANFPSEFLSGGSSHFILHRFPKERVFLGKEVTLEDNALVVDRDHDDGWAVGSLQTCAPMQLEVEVTVPQSAVEGPLYFNALFDWNHDGNWSGSSICPVGSPLPILPNQGRATPVALGNLTPEWAIQNLRLDLPPYDLKPGDKANLYMPAILAGSKEGELWVRLTVTTEPVDESAFVPVAFQGMGWDGQGDFVFGETEDYFTCLLKDPLDPMSGCLPLADPSPAGAAAGISIVKEAKTPLVQKGGSATFAITVTNTGDVNLSNVVVSDSPSPACTREVGDLPAGKSVTYECTVDNVLTDLTNFATVTGLTPEGSRVTAVDSATVIVPAELTVIKTVVNDNGGTASPGDFTLRVNGKNADPASFLGTVGGILVLLEGGNYSVSESGPSGYAATYSADCAGVIAGGESRTCTIVNDDQPATVTVIVDGDASASAWNYTGTGSIGSFSLPGSGGQTAFTLDAGNYTIAQSPDGDYFTSFSCTNGQSGSDSVSLNLGLGDDVTCTFTNTLKQPALSLNKSSSTASYDSVGDTISYSYLVKNTGNVTLTGITVTDNKATVSCPKSTLNSNESMTCTASYTATQADLDGGSVVNVATAKAPAVTSAGEVLSTPDSVTVPAQQNPALSMDKASSTGSYDSVGDTINYSYELTNTGNVTLSGPFSVSDNKAIVTCPATVNLAPGASITCTASYSVTQVDLNNGSVTNTATSTGSFGGTPVTSPPDSVTVDGDQNPSLSIDKTTSTASYDASGDILSYSYQVTNTGNVTLANITVSDNKATVSCPSTAGGLAPGGSITCSATYAVSQADVDGGSVTNTASAGATFGGSSVNSAPDSVTVDAEQNPSLSIDKSSSTASYDAVGDILSYSYRVTNSGNVTLTGVTVTDDKATVSCPKSTLAPNESMMCTASYTVTQADLDSGSVMNTASSSATFGGNPVNSPSDSVTVNADRNPTLSLNKSSSTGSYDSVGDVINYSYELTNTGNVTLSGPFSVTDNKATVTCPATGSLAPGAGITCTASYTITQADLDGGSVTNNATAAGSFDGNAVNSNGDSVTVSAVQNPALSLEKSSPTADYDAVGDVILYSYQLTNSGNVTLSGPFSVTDNKATVTCPATASLAPGASITCSASHTVTQADLDSGSVTNTATASGSFGGNLVNSNQDSVTVDADQGPVLMLDKSSATANYDAVGDVISYSYELENTGNVTLSGPFSVSDNKATVTCPQPAGLAPGDSITCTASYTVTQADLDSGFVTNTATATSSFGGNPVNSNQDSVTVNADQNPALSLDKTSNVSTYDAAGDVISYSYELTNTGNVTLSGPFSVSDDKATVSCPVTASLAPGASITCTASHTATQADVDAGSVTNTATAVGSFGGNAVSSNQDSVTVNALQNPALALDKTSSTGDYDSVGDTLSYSYLVTNSGNVTVYNIVVTDTMQAPATQGNLSAISCPSTAGGLAPGASITCMATYTVTQADIDNGSTSNGASATDGSTTSNTDFVTVNSVQGPALTLDKTTTTANYDSVGDTLSYSYQITNSGNVTLAGPFSVNDDKATVSCPVTASLAPGAFITCSASYSVAQADLDNGSVTNTASATNGQVTSPPDSVTVNAVQNPALSMDKTSPTVSYDSVGDVISYSYELTNTGNVTLSGPFSVSDDKATVTCPATATLAPGASITCSASYTVTQADLDDGSVTNNATASGSFDGNPVSSNQDSVTVSADQNPALGLDKTTSTASYDSVGDIISYSYELTNTGNVTLSGPFSVSDNKATVTCPATGSLEPSDSITCTASYSVTQADLDSGSVTNTATAAGSFGGNAVNSNQDSVTVNADQNPALGLDKTTSTASYDSVGDIISYSYELTNTGNVTLSGPFSVSDNKAIVSCPVTVTLAPGASITCSASYTVTQADLDAGSVTNTATAAGSFGGNPVTSPSDSVTVNALQNPALTLDKTSPTASYDSVGGVISYSYQITNSGNVTLSGPFTVSDNKATVSCTQPGDGKLSPGETMSCSASYTVTQADLDGGSVTNTATATNGAVTSPSDSVTVNAVQSPALTLDKTTSTADYDSVGDVISYSYLITNSGNVTLSGPLSVNDNKATVSCPATANLAPGASITCTASTTVTQADLNSGSVTNAATATNGAVTSNQDSVTVDADQHPALSMDKSSSTASYDAVGDILSYSYLVTNTGNVTVSGISASDDKATVSCPQTTLAPTESMTCNASTTVTQADLNSGLVTNTASAQGSFNGNPVTSNQDSVTVNAVQNPALTLDKSTSTGSYDAVNDVVSYSYLITNSGNVTLSGPFSVSDDKATVSCPATASLAPGASITCTATYTVTQADVDGGSVTNTATAAGSFGGNPVNSPPDSVMVNAVQSPALTLNKTTNTADYDSVGDVVSYSYQITNSGNVTLVGPFSVSDNKATVTCPQPGSLAPGAGITCSASYTVTQADLDSGSVTNTATAAGSFGGNPVSSNQDSVTVNAVQNPALTLDKTSSTGSYDSVGDVISYSYQITNSGNVTLSGTFSVSDNKATVTCPATASLAPGASITCSASYTVTQADLNSGSVTNTATATSSFGGNPVNSNQDSVTVNALQNPALNLDKTSSTASYDSVGDIISYSYELMNTGNVTLNGPFSVSDNKATVTCPATASLAPGASTTCSASYTVTQADLNSGSVTNTATATSSFGGNPVNSNQDSVTVSAVQSLALALDKTSDVSTYDAAGDVISYSYELTNSGNVTLSGPFTVTDNKATVTCPATASLAPGASITCSASYTVTQAEVNGGSVTNTATASGSFGGNPVSSNQDSVTVNALQNPELTLDKTSSTANYDSVGDVISYSYEVTNSGNVTVYNIVVTDTMQAPATQGNLSIISCPSTAGGLAPGASITCSATYTVTQDDVDNGSTSNGASATDGSTTSNTDFVTVNSVQGPALTLDKTSSTANYDAVNDMISYSYLITNTGNITISGPFSVNDDKATVSCTQPGDGQLSPGETMTCSASTTVTQADLDNGSVTNTASATNGTVTSPPDSVTVNAVQGPALALDKTSSTGGYDSVGDTINYSYELTNTGNVTLSNPFSVNDDKATVTCPQPASLAPGASITCTASTTVTQADLDSGSVVNAATASSNFGGNAVNSNQDSVTVSADQNPALGLDKTTSTASYDSVGDTISYSYQLTNTGNVTLTSPFSVNDDKATVTCPQPASLAPGASITCSASYTITQTDLNNGSVTNNAVALGTFGGNPVNSNPDSVTVNALQSTALTLDKTTSTADYDSVGDVISYSYLISNNGNVTLSGPFSVNDDKATVTCTQPGDGLLSPGETMTCSASYTVTQADLDSGSVTNTATATNGTVTSPSDSVTVNADQNPALTLDKTTSTANYDSVGDTITYSYLLTNSGNVTLSGLFSVNDNKATVSCPVTATLAPGASITCTASTTVTQADLDSGSVTNTATASGNFGGNPVSSNQDSVTVSADQNPALSLDKTSPTANYDSVGDVISYSYVIMNSGNVTLSGPFSVNDDKATVTCAQPGDGELSPGETMTCSASHTVTQADLDIGSVTNTATATNGTVTSPSDSVTVNADQNPALTLDKTSPTANYDSVGDVISYSYLITNSGNVTLSGPFSVSDNKTTVSCPATASLTPGDSISCSASYLVTQADLNSGSVTNTATATNGTTTSNSDLVTVSAVQSPGLSLDKTTSTADYDSVGDTITYSYSLTNTGNVTLSGPFSVSDDKVSVTCPVTATLAPGASITCSASYTVTQADLDSGSVTNTATAQGSFGGNPVTSNQDQVTVDADQNPALSLDKTTSTADYDSVGDTISYSYLITNTGNVTLSSPFSVSDNKTTVSCPVTATLAPGASITCSASYSVLQVDLNNGSVTNTAAASASFDGNGVSSNQDSVTVTADQNPALSLDKTTSTANYDSVGDTILYSYLITNSGNVTLTGPFSVSDNKATVSCSQPGDGQLSPGETMTCTASYTVTQADLDNGSVTNTATATNGATTSNSDSVTVNAVQSPALTLDKTTSTVNYDSVGDVISYSYLITNSGNVTLAGPFSVNDDKATVSCTQPGDGQLSPGETMTCTASHMATQADLDAGSVTNTATATNGAVTSPSDSVTVNAVQSPALTLDKSTTTANYDSVGDTISYGYVITNSGNVTLTGPFSVNDNKATVSCTQPGDGALSPGETMTCSASTTVTQADLDSGSVTNTATATNGTVTSPSDSVTVNAVQSPALTLDKTTSTAGYNVAGDVIAYSYLITNTGNVTLSGPFSVSDNKATVTCTQPGDGQLSPGETMTCSANYTVTQADVNNGSVTNTATATNGTVSSNQDSVTVNVLFVAALALDKSSGTASFDSVGDVISYSYVITNTGNVAINGPFSVSDDKATVTCPATASLAPSASITCTASYTVTQADLDSGSVTNTATAQGSYNGNPVTSNQDSVTVDADQNPALTLDKSSGTASYDSVGDVISYSYVITNTGNVTLSGPFSVSDNKATVSCTQPGDGALSPGETMTCSASYTVTQANLDSGSVTNTATATNGTVTSPSDSVTVNAVQTAALSLDKTTSTATYYDLGNTISYSYLLTNTGNVTLSGPFTVTDDKATVSCPVTANLALSASITCTATYTIVQTDIDDGEVTNTATAQGSFGGSPVTSNSDSVTVDGTPTQITVGKTVTNVTQPDVSTSEYFEEDQIQYIITVTNLGPVAAAVTVVDSFPAGLTFNSFSTATTTNWSCSGATSGQAGPRTITCTYTANGGKLPVSSTATITINATVNAGTNGTTITNTGEATWTPCMDGICTDSDDVEFDVVGYCGRSASWTPHWDPPGNFNVSGNTITITVDNSSSGGSYVRQGYVELTCISGDCGKILNVQITPITVPGNVTVLSVQTTNPLVVIDVGDQAPFTTITWTLTLTMDPTWSTLQLQNSHITNKCKKSDEAQTASSGTIKHQ